MPAGPRFVPAGCGLSCGCRLLDSFWLPVSLRRVLREGELMAIAFVFPGQGSQAVGMGLALANAFAIARHTFEEIDAALSDNLTRVMWGGAS